MIEEDLFEMSVGGAEEGDGVLLGGGQRQGSEEDIRVTQRRHAVDGHPPGDLQPHLAKVVDVPRRLLQSNHMSIKEKTRIPTRKSQYSLHMDEVTCGILPSCSSCSWAGDGTGLSGAGNRCRWRRWPIVPTLHYVTLHSIFFFFSWDYFIELSHLELWVFCVV